MADDLQPTLDLDFTTETYSSLLFPGANVYPFSLPGPVVNGYQIEPIDQVARTEMETGAARTRRRTKARNDLVSLSFIFHRAQFLEFREWFDSDSGAAGGAAWFFIELDVGALEIDYVDVRFKNGFKAARDGGVWRVTAQIEVRGA